MHKLLTLMLSFALALPASTMMGSLPSACPTDGVASMARPRRVSISLAASLAEEPAIWAQITLPVEYVKHFSLRSRIA